MGWGGWDEVGELGVGELGVGELGVGAMEGEKTSEGK